MCNFFFFFSVSQYEPHAGDSVLGIVVDSKADVRELHYQRLYLPILILECLLSLLSTLLQLLFEIRAAILLLNSKNLCIYLSLIYL